MGKIPKPPIIPGIDEESDQILVVNWFNRTHPDLAHKLHHSPNGGYRDKRTGYRMKLMGTKPGFHDLVLFHPIHPHTGLAIELKIGAGKLSKAQHDWIPILEACGFLVTPCWGYEAAVSEITNYLEGEQ